MNKLVAPMMVALALPWPRLPRTALPPPQERQAWQPTAATNERQNCPSQCREETNCYPGECYLVREELRCGPDKCVTRKACTPECR